MNKTVTKALADFASHSWVKLMTRAVIALDYEKRVKSGRKYKLDTNYKALNLSKTV